MLSQVDGKAESLEEGICLVPSKPLPVGESEFALLFPRGRSHDSGYGGGGSNATSRCAGLRTETAGVLATLPTCPWAP